MSAVGHTFEQLLTLCGWTKQHSSSSLEKHIASSFLETNEAVPQCHHRLLTAQFLCSVSPHAAWWIQQLMEALEKNLVNYINHQAQKRVVVVVKFGNVCNCNFFLSFFLSFLPTTMREALIHDDGLDLLRPRSHTELWMTKVLDDARHLRCPSSISFATFRMSVDLAMITQHDLGIF